MTPKKPVLVKIRCADPTQHPGCRRDADRLMDADDAKYVVPHGEGCVCRVTPSRSSGARTSPETIDHQRTLIDTLREVLEASEPRLVNRLAQVLEDHAVRYPATWRAAYRLKIVGEVLDELVEATDARVRVP